MPQHYMLGSLEGSGYPLPANTAASLYLDRYTAGLRELQTVRPLLGVTVDEPRSNSESGSASSAKAFLPSQKLGARNFP